MRSCFTGSLVNQFDLDIDADQVAMGTCALSSWSNELVEHSAISQCDAAALSLAALFPANIKWQCLPGLGHTGGSRTAAASRKQREFVLGRRAAYAALRKVGFRDPRIDELESHDALTEAHLNHAIGKNADRSPRWPTGFVGSISHSRNWIVAAAARHDQWNSIGIDSEPIADPQQAALLKQEIGHAEEWRLLEGFRLSLPAAFTLLFSAKEAFYKCWYPLKQRFLDFKDVIAVGAEPEEICAADGIHSGTITLAIIGTGEMQLPVRYRVTAEDVFTLAAISHRDSKA